MAVLASSPAWQVLQQDAKQLGQLHLKEIFAQDANRGQRDQLKAAGICVNLSRQRILPQTWQHLYALANQQELTRHIQALSSGGLVNHTEGRAALHTALRAQTDTGVCVAGEAVYPQVQEQLARMERLVQRIRAGQWRGFTGLPITDVVNMGVG
jgi:glucose-6-phosphate isomerase